MQSRDASAKALAVARSHHRAAIRLVRARADSHSPRKGSIQSLFDKEMAHMYDSGKVGGDGWGCVWFLFDAFVRWKVGWWYIG